METLKQNYRIPGIYNSLHFHPTLLLGTHTQNRWLVFSECVEGKSDDGFLPVAGAMKKSSSLLYGGSGEFPCTSYQACCHLEGQCPLVLLPSHLDTVLTPGGWAVPHWSKSNTRARMTLSLRCLGGSNYLGWSLWFLAKTQVSPLLPWGLKQTTASWYWCLSGPRQGFLASPLSFCGPTTYIFLPNYSKVLYQNDDAESRYLVLAQPLPTYVSSIPLFIKWG